MSYYKIVPAFSSSEYGTEYDVRDYNTNPDLFPFPIIMLHLNSGNYYYQWSIIPESASTIIKVGAISNQDMMGFIYAWRSVGNLASLINNTFRNPSGDVQYKINIPSEYQYRLPSLSNQKRVSAYGYDIYYAMLVSGAIYPAASFIFNNMYTYSSVEGFLSDIDDDIWVLAPISYPITYRLTNATTTGPNEAAVGDTVTVPLTFPEGYGVVNPSSDAYVTCNGVLVPSTYSNGQLVFTMPDPS